MKTLLHILLAFIPAITLYGQAEDEIATFVNLDAFVVSAALEDFDVEDFMVRVQTDTTFYQAFLNLKYFPHHIESKMSVYDKDSDELAWMTRSAEQRLSTNDLKWVEVVTEQSNGRLKKKNGEWKYLTAEMYDEVFFSAEKERVSNKMGDRNQELTHDSRMDKHQAQLKKMLFNPGEEIENVPFVGDKMAIFSPEMVPYYNYKVFEYTWADSIPCIAFACFVKEGMEDEVVILDLTSYFHRDTYSVVARDYHLAYNTLLFDFDIVMKVQNEMMENHLVPNRILYNGYWDVPFRKPEIISFELLNSAYKEK